MTLKRQVNFSSA